MGQLDGEIREKFSYQKEGEVILLENIRFYKEETENDEKFSKSSHRFVTYILMMLSHALIENKPLSIKLRNL